ncbi:MAG: hypothetical protein COT34_00435 [Candidatus Nealsonbacteria bacterium CG08_land_8_20_14_0_20_43_11]|uniref:Uncharacterized protein n=1 Tax=Candidatus Nealsonbacteria bacterium CG08_land_8_20_14_0_20_43_11 TaxID=1974706 RepID=A0A2M6T123_9BACT|nr:MAG: hypothetical protein COT34_00435 [Candidatus Nealsonbacteria bacterium CG08_land_8_20_14_0_20_43_11]
MAELKLNEPAAKRTLEDIWKRKPELGEEAIRGIIVRCLGEYDRNMKYIPDDEQEKDVWFTYRRHAGLWW